ARLARGADEHREQGGIRAAGLQRRGDGLQHPARVLSRRDVRRGPRFLAGRAAAGHRVGRGAPRAQGRLLSMARSGRPDPRQFDFFAQQELARRNTRRLLFWFTAAALGVVASYCLAFALLHGVLGLYLGLSPGYLAGVACTPPRLLAGVAGVVLATILAGSALRAWRMRHGGHAVAELLGARALDGARLAPTERRLVNVVEEMAIASGVTVPPVYVLRSEEHTSELQSRENLVCRLL